jgi:DNA mismatch repair protein MutS
LAEMSTGEFDTRTLADEGALLSSIQKYRPREVIFSSDNFEQSKLEKLRNVDDGIFWHAEALAPNWEEQVESHFGVMEIGKNNLNRAEKLATGLALTYLAGTQKTELGKGNLQHLKKINSGDNDLLVMDDSTIRNLEILENIREKKVVGSLLGVLDKTITSAGARKLRKLLVEPLAELEAIEARLGAIDLLLKHQNLILDLRMLLKGVLDIERIIGRLNLGSGNARDFRGLVASCKALREIKLRIEDDCPQLLSVIGQRFELFPAMIEELDSAVVDEPPVSVKEGGLIRDGYRAELDELRQLRSEGKSFIQSMQTREVQRTGISTLKVKFNRVFGYYIEVSNSNLAQVPEDYTRKQTLANSERFTTPELKEYEEKVLTAEEKIVKIELDLFEQLRIKVLELTLDIKETASASAYLDVLLTFAVVSWQNHYARPRISSSYDLKILQGRHPVIEKLNPQDKFIPNDTELSERQKMVLITGPNMGGKSTFLRQTAIIVLMAHLGMYVPAESAEIPLCDRIFTRVGASDNLVKGQSTFWVEMEETATILRHATSRSLIVLDEIGRGTSTFDGVSIAWGVMERIHNIIGAKTLFASHYHELIKLADNLSNAANYSVQVEEKPDGVVFLYKVAVGGVNRSYGIEVARLAGLPEDVIARAKEILGDLEKESIGTGQQSFEFLSGDGVADVEDFSEQSVHRSAGDADSKISQDLNRNHAGLEKLKNLNLDGLTPLDAMNQLNEIKKLIE